jgi:coenzyme F420-reducing hydrogenase delta subunit
MPDKLNPGDSVELKGLTEFEIDSATGLAPFEAECTTLLDEYTDASPNLLDEFESTRDIIFSLDPVPEESTEVPPDEPKAEASEQETSEETIEPARPIEPEPPEREEERAPEDRFAEPQPARPVIGFVCKHSVNLSEITDSRGRMAGRTTVSMIELPCAGMVKPSWLEHALEKGASGVFVVACEPGSCYHRRGGCVFEGRWDGSREPAVGPGLDRSHARLFHSHYLDRMDLLKEIEKFLQEIARMELSTSLGYETPEELGESDPL